MSHFYNFAECILFFALFAGTPSISVDQAFTFDFCSAKLLGALSVIKLHALSTLISKALKAKSFLSSVNAIKMLAKSMTALSATSQRWLRRHSRRSSANLSRQMRRGSFMPFFVKMLYCFRYCSYSFFSADFVGGGLPYLCRVPYLR